VKLKNNVDVFLDVHEFETRIANGDLRKALDLYGGELLAGLHVKDSSEFENWRRLEQERLHLLLVDGLQMAISTELSQGDYKNSQNLSMELLGIDPLNENALQQCMIALAVDGKPADALKQYKQYTASLLDELGTEPSPETEELKELISQREFEALLQKIMPKNNLPSMRTSFIGREEEVALVVDLIRDDSCRLLTLTGPGGVGKTRLALGAAKNLLGFFPDGVYFIPLEKVPSPDFLIPAISEPLDFGFDQNTLHWKAKDQVINFLNDRSVLLILDGYEHLTDASDFLSELLKHAPNVQLLVTSRQKVNIQGEWVQPVLGLPVPEHWETGESDGGTSLDLYLARARQANPSLNLSGEELASALQICQLVEGFPLAVELAASWTALLSSAEIADEISRSFSFLTSQTVDVPDKQRSLQAVFNYSWQMLEEEQREVLVRLSAFHGGFTRQAAQEVANATWMSIVDLANKSLVRRSSDGRFDLHRMIRHFTKRKMKEYPDISKDIDDRHSRYYLGSLRNREADLTNERMTVTREEFRPEIENLRAAVKWAVLNWEADLAAEAVYNYFSFYVVHGWHDGELAFDQLADWIQMNAGDSVRDIEAAYLSCRSHQAWFCSNLAMIEKCEKITEACLQPIKERDMKRELALSLHNLGVCAEFRGDYDLSIELLEESIELGERHPFLVVPSFYLWLGYVQLLVGDYEDGMASFNASYARFMQERNTWGSSFALSKMGLAAVGLGDYASAMRYFGDAYEIFLDTGDITGQAYSLSRMSIGAYFLSDYLKAVEVGEEALELFREIGHRWGICASLGHVGFAYVGLGRMQKARAKFLETLEQASDTRMAPLSLYGLAGLASIFVSGEAESEGWALFNFVRSHPRMIALYIDVAKRWFENKSQHLPEGELGEDDDMQLAEIVEAMLEREHAGM
jgi:predicted ATPase